MARGKGGGREPDIAGDPTATLKSYGHRGQSRSGPSRHAGGVSALSPETPPFTSDYTRRLPGCQCYAQVCGQIPQRWASPRCGVSRQQRHIWQLLPIPLGGFFRELHCISYSSSTQSGTRTRTADHLKVVPPAVGLSGLVRASDVNRTHSSALRVRRSAG